VPRLVPLRVILESSSGAHKFLALHAGGDNSLYFHPYRPQGEPWFEPPATARAEAEKIRLHFPSFAPSSFNFHKLSFHPSGFVHATDKGGARRKSGVRGPAFDEMTLPYDCAVFVPCDPVRLPVFTGGRGFPVRIALPEDARPFYMTFSIIRADDPPRTVQGPYIPHPLNFVFPGMQFGVALTIWPVKAQEESFVPTWPPFPFYFVRTAA